MEMSSYSIALDPYMPCKLYTSQWDTPGGGWACPQEEHGQTLGIVTEKISVKPPCDHGSLWGVRIISDLPKVHTHFCYKFQCQNSPGSIRACQNPQGWGMSFIRIHRVVHPLRGHHIDWCITSVNQTSI